MLKVIDNKAFLGGTGSLIKAEIDGERVLLKTLEHPENLREKYIYENIISQVGSEHFLKYFGVHELNDKKYIALEFIENAKKATTLDIATTIDLMMSMSTLQEHVSQNIKEIRDWRDTNSIQNEIDTIYKFNEILSKRITKELGLKTWKSITKGYKKYHDSIKVIAEYSYEFIHGDFGCSNLLQNNDGYKIIDWGLAVYGNTLFDVIDIYKDLEPNKQFETVKIIAKELSSVGISKLLSSNIKVEKFLAHSSIGLAIPKICFYSKQILDGRTDKDWFSKMRKQVALVEYSLDIIGL